MDHLYSCGDPVVDKIGPYEPLAIPSYKCICALYMATGLGSYLQPIPITHTKKGFRPAWQIRKFQPDKTLYLAMPSLQPE